MYVARAVAQRPVQCFIFLWPHCKRQLPDPRRAVLIFLFFFQSKNFTCFCTLSSAASITQGCTGSARSTAVTTTQSAARTAEKQLKSYLVVKWKTLAAFGQWCIFHCVQQLMFTTSAETLNIYWPFCQTGQRDETPWSWLNCKHSFSDKQWETLSSTDPEPVWRYWHFNDQ